MLILFKKTKKLLSELFKDLSIEPETDLPTAKNSGSLESKTLECISVFKYSP